MPRLGPQEEMWGESGQCERAVGVIMSSICAGNSLVWCLCVAVNTEDSVCTVLTLCKGHKGGKVR